MDILRRICETHGSMTKPFRYLAFVAGFASCFAQENYDLELREGSESHMREELGVNDITTPSIRLLLQDLGTFQPVPIEIINRANRDATFNNRVQTAMHFGSLVADGFMLTIAERPSDVQSIGRALIRQSRALGVGDRLTSRSKSLLEYSDKGDWIGMREELVKTQEDVENAMMELRDEQLAHLISLGGWMRGFQLSAHVVADHYTPAKAQGLVRPEIMSYFIERLETLHPRLRKTELINRLLQRLKALRALAEQSGGRALSLEEVQQMKNLADEMEQSAMAQVDEEGRILNTAE